MVSKVPLWCSYWTNILEWLSQSLFFFSLNHISFKLGGCFRHISRSFGCYSRRRANLKRVTARRYYRHYIIQYGVGYVTVLSVRILILLRGRSTRSWSRSEQLPTSSNWLRLTSSGVLRKVITYESITLKLSSTLSVGANCQLRCKVKLESRLQIILG